MADYIVEEIELPKLNDKYQWYPGGTLRNETYPGGVNFSPTALPSLDLKVRYLDQSTALLNGLHSYILNPSFSAINSFINLGMFELIAMSERQSEISTYSVTVEIVDTVTNDILFSSSRSSDEFESVESIESLASSYTLNELSQIADNPIELSKNVFANPLIGVIHVASSFDTTQSIEVNLGRVAYGTVLGGLRNVAINKTLDALSLSARSMPGLIVGSLIGAIINEAIEIAMGLDNSFGFGGEYNSQVSNRLGVDAYEVSRGFLGMDSFADEVAFNLGLDGITRSYENYDGTLTYSTRTYNSDGDMISGFDALGEYGYREITETYISETVDYTMRDIGDDYGSTTGWSADGSTFSGYDGMGSYDADARSVGLSSSDEADSSSSSGDSGGDDGGRHCCTVLVKRKIWRMKRLKDLGVWDKKQNLIWRVGYQIGGKMVAKYYDKDERIDDYTKMMNAFYDTHILGKKRTIDTYRAYLRIYPAVYVTGVYKVIKDLIYKIFKK